MPPVQPYTPNNEFVNSIIDKHEKKPSILTAKGSAKAKGKHRRAISDGRSQKSESKVRFSPDVSDNKSNYSSKSKGSKRSGMTRNPLHYEENMHHIVPGIDDSKTHLYREYDSRGRMNESFYRRATLAGIKNLETNCFRKDSPVDKNKGRFPEKYSELYGSKVEPG
jgi:hypothetical protein